MNYTYDEALKMVGDFLEANEANYAVKCAWEVVSNNQQYTEEELDDAYDSGYEDAKAEYGCWSDE